MNQDTPPSESFVSFDDTAVAFESKTDQDLNFSIFMFKLMGQPALVKMGTSLTLLALKMRLPIEGIIKGTVFRQFCGGVSIEDCEPKIKRLGQSHIGAILDLSVEGQEDEESFDKASDELLVLVKNASKNKDIPVCCMKVSAIARHSILEKVAKGDDLSMEEKKEYANVVRRLNLICGSAEKHDVPIYIDAEESWIQDAIDRLTETMMSRYNKKKAYVFTTFQFYRWDRIDYLKRLLSLAERENFKLGAKFVRGAYMEKERKRAEDNGYKDPIQPNKEATDNDFNSALEIALEHLDRIEFVCGTHNEDSCMKLVHMMHEQRIEQNHPSIYFSQLFGMSDHISYNLSFAGFNVTKYLPYGPIRDAVPYLIRRVEENTAVAGQMGQELKLLLSEKQRREKVKKNT